MCENFSQELSLCWRRRRRDLGKNVKEEEGGETERGESCLYIIFKSQIEPLASSLGGNFKNSRSGGSCQWITLLWPPGHCLPQVKKFTFATRSPNKIYRWWEQNEATFLAKGPAGKALVSLAKRWIWLLLFFNPILLQQVSNTSSNIYGSGEALQCSRTNNGCKKE